MFLTLITLGRMDETQRIPRLYYIIQARHSRSPGFSTQKMAIFHFRRSSKYQEFQIAALAAIAEFSVSKVIIDNDSLNALFKCQMSLLIQSSYSTGDCCWQAPRYKTIWWNCGHWCISSCPIFSVRIVIFGNGFPTPSQAWLKAMRSTTSLSFVVYTRLVFSLIVVFYCQSDDYLFVLSGT